jgi:hypothetical protein
MLLLFILTKHSSASPKVCPHYPTRWRRLPWQIAKTRVDEGLILLARQKLELNTPDENDYCGDSPDISKFRFPFSLSRMAQQSRGARSLSFETSL